MMDVSNQLLEYNTAKEQLLEKLFSCIEPEDRLHALSIISEYHLLETQGWSSDCPPCVYKLIKGGYYNKYETVNFYYALQTRFDNDELSDNESINLINEVFLYVKENRRIGTKHDW